MYNQKRDLWEEMDHTEEYCEPVDYIDDPVDVKGIMGYSDLYGNIIMGAYSESREEDYYET